MSEPNTEGRRVLHIDCLQRIGLFLEGYKAGKGNVRPLGTKDLESLWEILSYPQYGGWGGLKGNTEFKCRELEEDVSIRKRILNNN